MSAKNKHSLAKFVGTTFFRKAGSHGAWQELASARGTVASVDTTKQNVDVVCDTRGSVFKGTIPEAMISLTFLENADTSIMSKLFGLTQTAQVAGAKTMTSELYTFDEDGKIVLDEFSNDGAGVTVTTMKSVDGVTTYAATTGYLKSVLNNVTTLTLVEAGGLVPGDTVAITGTVNVNASESIELTSEFMLKQEFDVKVEAVVTKEAKDYRRIIKLNPATLESTFALEFLDVVKAGDIKGATVDFKLSEGGKFTMYDEIITDEISG